MLDPQIQKALDNLQTFEIKPLSTDQLNGLTTVDLSSLTPASVGAIGSGYTLASGTSGSINWQSPNVYTTTAVGSTDRKSTRLNSSHIPLSRMPSSA